MLLEISLACFGSLPMSAHSWWSIDPRLHYTCALEWLSTSGHTKSKQHTFPLIVTSAAFSVTECLRMGLFVYQLSVVHFHECPFVNDDNGDTIDMVRTSLIGSFIDLPFVWKSRQEGAVIRLLSTTLFSGLITDLVTNEPRMGAISLQFVSSFCKSFESIAKMLRLFILKPTPTCTH